MKNKLQYKAFGDLLASLRVKAGIANQAELAIRIKSAQQTISRYEKGLSRPRDRDMPSIAMALNADVNELLAAAGYTQKSAIAATFDQPLPVDALSPDSFERFCLYFLECLYRDAQVHRVGSTGHKQDGLDIDVTFPDGTVYTFQCKRVQQFGAGKVKTAVEAHTRVAAKKFFLISRIASPGMRGEVSKYHGWDVWDKEDISLKVRAQLPKEDQLKLVDIFFQGQRLALLGETEAGPWQTLDDFLAPFEDRRTAFNHHWALVGRDADVKGLQDYLANDATIMTLLLGAGGLGKTRLIAHALRTFQKARPNVLLRVLSASELITSKSLENLGQGAKLLVIDDAHEREDLRAAFEYAANSQNKARLLVSARLYGASHIRNQAASVSLVEPYRVELKLEPLSKDAANELARQVLKEYGGSEEAASAIARMTWDCPLATVMGAQIVAKERIHPELVHNQEKFRETLLAKFASVIAGEIAAGADIDKVTRILRVLALVQPFSPEDPALRGVLQECEGVSFADGNRLIRLLIDAGVLFRRGGKYRISPDLLADHLIESSCVTPQGNSSGYAEQVFDKSPPPFLERIMVNLGKLDWRRANGDPSNSRLLDTMWSKLHPTDGHADSHMDAVSAVAYYQPGRALDFAEMAIREDRSIRGLSEVVKHAAYNYEFVTRACACLWEMGRDDVRQLNQYPSHAIRILKELCAVSPGKPIEYNEKVVEFALGLLDSAAAWQWAFNPYEILEGILQTEGHTTTSNGISFTMSPFLVRQQAVQALRLRVVDAAIERLDNADPRIAVHSAEFLEGALRFPMGLMGATVSDEDRNGWALEFISTMEKIEGKVRSGGLDPVVCVELRKSVSWHAHHSRSKTGPVARRVLSSLPNSLEDRTILALVDGYGHHAEETDLKKRRDTWQTTLGKLADELISTFPEPALLREYVAKQLTHVRQAQRVNDVSPDVLYGELMHRSAAFCRSLAEDALAKGSGDSMEVAGRALASLTRHDMSAAVGIIEQMMQADVEKFKAEILSAIAGAAWSAPLSEPMINFLRAIMATGYLDYYSAARVINVIRGLVKHAPILAGELLAEIPFVSAKAADDAISIHVHEAEIGLEKMPVDAARAILDKLEPLHELEGYWIEKFLAQTSEKYPMETAEFFMRRVDRATLADDYSFRPCNWGPYVHSPLQFVKSAGVDLVRRQIWAWMRRQTAASRIFMHHAAHFFVAAFFPMDHSLVVFLQERMRGDVHDMQLIMRVLREAPYTVVFDHSAFIVELLEVAEGHGRKIADDVRSSVLTAALTGERSGTSGEPFPRDVKSKASAEEILQRVSPMSPAYRLYDAIKKNAEEGITRSLAERDEFEDT